MTASTRPAVMLIHGAWHDGRVWGATRQHLLRSGYDVWSPTLPGRGRAPGADDLAGHAAFVIAEAASLDRDIVLVGHSYGGAVITEVGDRIPRLRGLVYFAGFQLQIGESCLDVNGSDPGSESGADAFDQVGDGYVLIQQEAACEAFYHDLPPTEALRLARRLTPESTATIGSPVTSESWRSVPSGYIVATRDRAIVPSIQGLMATRADFVTELESSHSGMISSPYELASMLVAAMANLSATSGS